MVLKNWKGGLLSWTFYSNSYDFAQINESNVFHIEGRWTACLQCELSCAAKDLLDKQNTSHTDGKWQNLLSVYFDIKWI